MNIAYRLCRGFRRSCWRGRRPMPTHETAREWPWQKRSPFAEKGGAQVRDSSAIGGEHFSGARIHKMGLAAGQARHRLVRLVIRLGIGIIGNQTLDFQASVGAPVNEGWHGSPAIESRPSNQDHVREARRSRSTPVVEQAPGAILCRRWLFVDGLWAAPRIEIGPGHNDAEGCEHGHDSDEHKNILSCHGHTSPVSSNHNRPVFLSF